MMIVRHCQKSGVFDLKGMLTHQGAAIGASLSLLKEWLYRHVLETSKSLKESAKAEVIDKIKSNKEGFAS